MTTTYLIALSNGLAKPKCIYCTNPATEEYDNEPLCYPHYVSVERADE